MRNHDWMHEDGFWWGVKATIDDVLWGMFWGAVTAGIIFSLLF